MDDFLVRLIVTILMGLGGCGCAHVEPSFREVIIDPDTGAKTTTILKAPATVLGKANIAGDGTVIHYQATTTNVDTGIVESFELDFGAHRESMMSDVDVAALATAIAKALAVLSLPIP